MTFRITLTALGEDDFCMEMLLDADATFLDLHRLILEGCGYTEADMHRFYICDEDWRPEARILLQDDGSVGSDEDLNLMEHSHLGDFLEDEGQRMAYSYDPESPRKFLLELTETIFGHPQPEPAIRRRHGTPPLQSLEPEEEPAKPAVPQSPLEELEEEFQDNDTGFDADELDVEGFDILN